MGEAVMGLGGFKRLLALCGYPQVRVLPTTWSSKPAANSVLVGQIIQITDYGNKLFYSDGSIWRQLGNAPWDQSGAPVSVTGTTSETALATIAVPGGLLGTKGRLRITASYSYTNNAHNKNLIERFGGVAIRNSTRTTASNDNIVDSISNRGSANSQIAALGFSTGTANSIQTTLSVDTSVAQNLVLAAQLSDATDTITLESYTVEALVP